MNARTLATAVALVFTSTVPAKLHAEDGLPLPPRHTPPVAFTKITTSLWSEDTVHPRSAPSMVDPNRKPHGTLSQLRQLEISADGSVVFHDDEKGQKPRHVTLQLDPAEVAKLQSLFLAACSEHPYGQSIEPQDAGSGYEARIDYEDFTAGHRSFMGASLTHVKGGTKLDAFRDELVRIERLCQDKADAPDEMKPQQEPDASPTSPSSIAQGIGAALSAAIAGLEDVSPFRGIVDALKGTEDAIERTIRELEEAAKDARPRTPGIYGALDDLGDGKGTP